MVLVVKLLSKKSKSKISEFGNLYQFAKEYGVTKYGFVASEILEDYRQSGTHCRLWPQTELLKAELMLDSEDRLNRINHALLLLIRFTDCGVAGLWYETFDLGKGLFNREPAKASSLYHLVCSINYLVENSSI